MLCSNINIQMFHNINLYPKKKNTKSFSATKSVLLTGKFILANNFMFLLSLLFLFEQIYIPMFKLNFVETPFVERAIVFKSMKEENIEMSNDALQMVENKFQTTMWMRSEIDVVIELQNLINSFCCSLIDFCGATTVG